MSFQPPSNHRSKGFTLIELLVVISIIAILAGMLLPVIGVVREMARQSQCGKNQSQILGAMLAYSTSEETGWPDPRGIPGRAFKLAEGEVTLANSPRFTAGCFELIAVSQSIPNALFKCPSTSTGGASRTLKATLSEANTNWGWNPPTVGVSYAFDWAAPTETGSARVVLADRDPKHHNMNVVACFGDAHVKKLKKPATGGGGGGTNRTVGLNGPITVVIENPDAKGAAGSEDVVAEVTIDNIYDDSSDVDPMGGDAADVLRPGNGHSKRAWVK